MAKFIKTNGKVTDVKPDNGDHFTLSELQGFVGGYIEIVRTALRSGRGGRGDDGDVILVIDEEGKLKNKPINAIATSMYDQACGGWSGDLIVGDALLGTVREIDGPADPDER